MNCIVCRFGHVVPGHTTITLERGKTIFILKHVPAGVCDSCGEYYLDSAVAAQVQSQATEAFEKGAELEVLSWKLAS